MDDRRKKINNNLLFHKNTQYESVVTKNNHFKDSLEKKNTGRSVLKIAFLTGGNTSQDEINRSFTHRNHRGRSHNRGIVGPMRNIQPKNAQE